MRSALVIEVQTLARPISQGVFCAIRLLCQPALAHDLAVPDLVAARLSCPAAIAVYLARDLERVRAILAHEEFDALLARPAFGVEARVDDEAARTEGERLEITQAPDLEIIIEAKLVGELLGV